MKKDSEGYGDINFLDEKDNIVTKSKSKRDIKVIIVLCIFLFMSIGGYILYTKNSKDDRDSVIKENIVDLNNILTNLSTNSKNPVYINVNISLKLQNNHIAKIAQKNLPQIENAVIIYIRELTPMDINAPGGTMMLVDGIKTRVNTIMSPDSVEDVILRSIVIK